ncbi:hypothetical protein [Puniceicoccus vermicola]|uniref:Uncharacterized protein n=1 Tax=Puniceicoccus vermicola TaxID=388746 RepID=A0A7X1E3L9_9BACT|nr:hypothetical protein [Puniceicoccus vermicola]MBC2601113.1 hypothetical protein [Puniceicoccus vermicola]
MKPYPVFFTLLITLLGYNLAFQFTRYTEWTVDLEVQTGGILKWYVDSGNGFSEEEGNYGSVPEKEKTQVQVLLSTGAPRKIRLDPVNTESEIILGKVRWDEPWPGGSGQMDLEKIDWENVSVAEKDGSGKWRLEPLPESTDVYGVWREVPTHSLLWWRLVRLSVALVLGICAFVGGTIWNRKILREAKGEEGAPPLVV